jgi:hypothetical protein
VKLALVAPAETFTETGTVTKELLLARVTVEPALGAAAVSVAVQATCTQPVVVEGEQVNALSAGVVAPKVAAGKMLISIRTSKHMQWRLGGCA